MTAPTTRTLGRDDWTTPWELFEPIHHVARFTGDACATDSRAARCAPFISPEEDALATPWGQLGERVWCNPPYGREIGQWFARVVDQVAAGVEIAAGVMSQMSVLALFYVVVYTLVSLFIFFDKEF